MLLRQRPPKKHYRTGRWLSVANHCWRHRLGKQQAIRHALVKGQIPDRVHRRISPRRLTSEMHRHAHGFSACCGDFRQSGRRSTVTRGAGLHIGHRCAPVFGHVTEECVHVVTTCDIAFQGSIGTAGGREDPLACALRRILDTDQVDGDQGCIVGGDAIHLVDVGNRDLISIERAGTDDILEDVGGIDSASRDHPPWSASLCSCPLH